MRSSISLFLGAVLAVADGCLPVYQRIMFVQDTNKEMSSAIPKLRNEFYGIATALEKLTDKVAIGLTEFSDKGLPYTGWGGHLNALNGKDVDTCYKPLVPIYLERPQLHETLGKLKPRLGGDPDGSHLEALLYAAQDEGNRFWKENALWNNNRIIRDLVLFTDQIPHEAGDAKDLINAFNAKPSTNGDSTPIDPVGFGSENMYKIDAATVWANGTKPYTESNYDDFAKLRLKKDDKGLTDSEDIMYRGYVSIFGPEKYDGRVSDHDGKASDPADPAADCKKKDYPTWKQLAAELKKNDMGLTVIVHETGTRASRRLLDYCPMYLSDKFTKFNKASDRAKCVKIYWENHLAPLRLPFARVVLASDGTYANMISGAIKKHNELECKKFPF